MTSSGWKRPAERRRPPRHRPRSAGRGSRPTRPARASISADAWAMPEAPPTTTAFFPLISTCWLLFSDGLVCLIGARGNPLPCRTRPPGNGADDQPSRFGLSVPSSAACRGGGACGGGPARRSPARIASTMRWWTCMTCSVGIASSASGGAGECRRASRTSTWTSSSITRLPATPASTSCRSWPTSAKSAGRRGARPRARPRSRATPSVVEPGHHQVEHDHLDRGRAPREVLGLDAEPVDLERDRLGHRLDPRLGDEQATARARAACGPPGGARAPAPPRAAPPGSRRSAP